MSHLDKLDTYSLRIVFEFATITDHASLGECLGLTYTPTTLERLGAYLPGCEKRKRAFTTSRCIELVAAYNINIREVNRYFPQSWDCYWGYWLREYNDRKTIEYMMQYADKKSLKRTFEIGDAECKSLVMAYLRKKDIDL